MGPFRHAIAVYVLISAVLITVALGFPPLPSITCSVQTAAGANLQCGSTVSYKKDCRLHGRQNGERKIHSSSLSAQGEEEEEEEEREEIIIRERTLDTANSFVDINFPLWHTRRAAVVVAGRSSKRSGHRQRCIVVMVTLTAPGRVTLHNLALPHGSYQVQVVKRRGGGGVRGEERKAALVVVKQPFVLPRTDRRQHRAHSRSRRHNSLRRYGSQETLPTVDVMPDDPNPKEQRTQEEEEEGGGREKFLPFPYAQVGVSEPCVCCRCFAFVLDYDEMTASLTFSYHLNDTCDPACSTVNVQLYRNDLNESQCEAETSDSYLAERIGLDKNVTKGPLQYGNVGKGCYFVELKPHLYRLPEQTPAFWVEPAIDVINFTAWNTVFSMEPNPERRSLTVRWTRSQPYNFSRYHLILQHHPRIHINCTGQAIYPNMSIIPKGRLVVRQPIHIFHNLTRGWYCARVTPLDDRCPLDGCPVRSNPAQLLTEPLARECEDGSEDERCEGKSALRMTLLVVGCVLGAVATGVTVAWGILHSWPTISHVFTSATHYSPVPVRPASKTTGARKQIVLLVWTPQGPHGSKIGPVITAFKTVLRTYSHCEVYDYLDFSSLPERHQLHLLASPTTWLDSILAQRSIKIIIVATEGAWQRQMEWKQPMPSPRRDVEQVLPSPHHTHDQMLFPYLLRQLHDQPDLAGDYSRVFHVRFSEISHSAVELGNIVSWKRYKIPEHLKTLTVSLHGGVGAASFEEPTEDQLKDLQEVLTSHPQHRSHVSNGSGPPRPSLVGVSNGTTKTLDSNNE